MRRIFSFALVVLAITSAAAAFGADNSLGTWKANIEKTKHTPPPWPVKSLTSVREAVPGGVKVTNTTTVRLDLKQNQLVRVAWWI